MTGGNESACRCNEEILPASYRNGLAGKSGNRVAIPGKQPGKPQTVAITVAFTARTHLRKYARPIENVIATPFTTKRRREKIANIAAFFIHSIDINRKLR